MKKLALTPRVKDLLGKKFTRLSVESFVGLDKSSNALWLCKCVCGNYTTVRGFSLVDETTKSCGCLQKDTHHSTHNSSHTPEYIIWKGMWSRCRSTEKYKDRTPVDRWKDFANFLLDMGHRPSPSDTLEWVNNLQGYGPHNCVWATRKVQNSNRENTLFLRVGSVEKPVLAWAEENGIAYNKLRYRLRAGWPAELAIDPNAKMYKSRNNKVNFKDKK
jgi:hypothetical protein